jgi:hypothetical protein
VVDLGLQHGPVPVGLQVSFKLSISSQHAYNNTDGTMARKKMDSKDKQQFRNVGLLLEDHELLRKIADSEQRSMARQLSVMIRKEIDQRGGIE